MIKKKYFVLLCLIALLGFGCETPILRQDIPVSSNPVGAKIYADGRLFGQTPGTVSLERTRDHILTIVKENYRQEDLMIRKQYQSNKVLMKAVQSGVNSGLFFKDTRMGVNSGFSSISRQEETGEAYILVPPAVIVNLVPLYSPTTGVSVPPPGLPGAQGTPPGQPPVTYNSPPADTESTIKDVFKAGIVAGAAAGAVQTKPIEKKWETSSSSRSYTKSDGTMVTEKSGTSVSVSVNPAAAMVNLIDILSK
ncbi:MAG: PEGA domain-containing protein [Proteobacteria bacterium]|nr:PEGA domain-containing protein [Pseudomonadota bacterium]